MGIRFYCPNGHKLNVKEFQAGQRGMCPRCGASMTIPLESTRPAGSKDLPIAAEWEAKARREGTLPQNFDAQVSSSSGIINLNAIHTGLFSEAGEQQAVGAIGMSNVPADIPKEHLEPSAETSVPSATPANATPGPVPMPPLPTVEPPKPQLPDPFEGPADTVWYVRPSAGGQYGPVDREAIKVWLSEGRIVADTLVWREGWAEWKRGDETFEALAPAPAIAPPPIMAPPVGGVTSSVSDIGKSKKKTGFWGFGKK
ncbi:MAG: DUF4339 domain-containing protein [Planctomycetia bacterium]|nr:DUF4339 domain-containing protein [Planctomycetia bacterium]